MGTTRLLRLWRLLETSFDESGGGEVCEIVLQRMDGRYSRLFRHVSSSLSAGSGWVAVGVALVALAFRFCHAAKVSLYVGCICSRQRRRTVGSSRGRGCCR